MRVRTGLLACFYPTVALVMTTISCDSSTDIKHNSYWLWAGLTAADAPANAELYLFQGTFSTTDKDAIFERQGLFPHPLKSSRVILVYRLEGNIPKASDVAKVFESALIRWKRHSVAIAGIQLDFDSPTSKLVMYSDFIEEVRQRIPSNYSLSITGLGDWAVGGSREALQSISVAAEEIVFQLYQGRQPLGNIDDFVYSLVDYPHPFRVGLISNAALPKSLKQLDDNPNFRGIVYFVVRTR